MGISAASGSGRAPAIPREIEALRAQLDARLTALEAALADPAQHGSLEQIILDLARVATEEADVTARQASLNAQREAQGAAAAVLAEERAAREAEQAAVVSLRASLEQAQAALQAERTATTTRERDLAALRKAVEQAQAALQGERAAAAARAQDLATAQQAVERDVAALKQGLEQERSARSGLQRELEQSRAALEAEKQAAPARDRELAAARQALQLATVRDREIAAAQQALEKELEREQKAHAKLRVEFDEARKKFEAERVAGAKLRETIADQERNLGLLRRDVEAHSKNVSRTQADLEQALRDSEARYEKLRQTGEKEIRALVLAVKDAETRAETAIRERPSATGDSEEVSEAAVAAQAEAEARYEKLRDASEKQVRALELAVRMAEERADAAQNELDRKRHDVLHAKTHEAVPKGDAIQAAQAHAAQPHAAGAPPAAAQAPFEGPVRATQRYVMAEQVAIQVDGTPGKLIDVSTGGAQILSSAAMKPNRVMKLTLPLANGVVAAKGKIMWSRLEPAAKGGQMWYRAGVSFTAVDLPGIEAFIRQQEKKK